MAIGNFYNDITMLTFAGLGIAMDNSPIEVKAAAQDVTASNNEEGVRLALEKYCL
ncbi:Sugar phosphatase YidA [compost metagenome]